VVTSDLYLIAMYSTLLYCMYCFGGGTVARLYWAPWLVFVVWLDLVTYLHHHGLPTDSTEKMPWYRCVTSWNQLESLGGADGDADVAALKCQQQRPPSRPRVEMPRQRDAETSCEVHCCTGSESSPVLSTHTAACCCCCFLRGAEWSYLRGGLTTLDHDYGLFNKIHHDIGTHVVHHLVRPLFGKETLKRHKILHHCAMYATHLLSPSTLLHQASGIGPGCHQEGL
jgi:hypothetical protein